MRWPPLLWASWWCSTAAAALLDSLSPVSLRNTLQHQAIDTALRVRRSGGYPKFPPTRPPSTGFLGDSLGGVAVPGPSTPWGTVGGLCGTRAIAHQPRRAGAPYPKIVGGTPVPYGAYPWQVEIQLREDEDEGRGVEDEDAAQQSDGGGGKEEDRRWGGYAAALGDGYRHHCGGAVVGERLVVSAAHCLQGAEAERLRVVVGEHRLRTPDGHERAFAVEQVLTHPQFRRAGPYSNDIGLLKVGSPLPLGTAPSVAGLLLADPQPPPWAFSTHVRSICLPEDAAAARASGHPPSPPPGAWCTVTGWGAQRADDSESLSEVLRAAAVPLLDPATCRNASVYGGRSQSILDSMLCAGLAEGGVDACAGDSGGPLACEVNGRFVLAGVVSWGDGCAKKNRPGVYTRISHYTNWIQASMKKLGL